ncbi:MAG TPA: DNA polymerase III subunit delta [Methylomirabilota bacterium]|nr:DNA polymerase III subunit delta [Methylomirabilota bacterium]
MKVAGYNVESFLRGIDARFAAVLLYGPDRGLVRERADRVTAAVSGDAGDPFRVSEIPLARLRNEPTILVDEAAALTLDGGRRVVRLRDAGDGAADAVEAFLSMPALGGLLLLEADDLGARSPLRRICEAAGNAAALPCYHDEGEDIGRLVGEELRRAGLHLADDAREFLLMTLGGDRGVTRREIEKLVGYMGQPTDGRTVTLADAMACIGDSAALTVDDLVLAVGDGDLAAVERLTTRCLQEGNAPVTILRATGRHFLRLHQIAAAEGDRQRAVDSLRPPVFYKHKPRVLAQAQRWPTDRLHGALDRLTDAESECKRTGAPDVTLCRRALLEIAAQALTRASARGGSA